MPLFKCSQCGCVENTALSNWAIRFLYKREDGSALPPLCSACDPAIGKWHGEFPQRPWDAEAEQNSGMPKGWADPASLEDQPR
jgi:hypothetical protein